MARFAALEAVIDRAKGQFQSIFDKVRARLLGTNNERLDFIMDSFYKLNPSQRTGALTGLVGVIALFLLGSLGLYYARVNSLRAELESGFEALHELQSLKAVYAKEDQRFVKLVDNVTRKTRNVKAKPLFEKVAREQNVSVEGLKETKNPLSTENPLAEKMDEVRVDFSFTNISIPRLLNFLVEIEKSNALLRIQDFKVKGRYGTKLYFDADAKVRGYSTDKSGG